MNIDWQCPKCSVHNTDNLDLAEVTETNEFVTCFGCEETFAMKISVKIDWDLYYLKRV